MMRTTFLLGLALAVSACSLRPMYAEGASGAVATGLRSIDVQPIPGKSGWLVHKALVDRLGDNGEAAYRLEVELDNEIIGFGIRGDSAATRERQILRARYRLVDAATGGVVLDATAGYDASNDVVSSPYATVAAEQTALERLAGIVADQMVARLGAYMTRSNGSR